MPSKWYSDQPTNRNFLAPAGFKLELDLFPGVDFFCQKINLPDISVPNAVVPTPFRNVPIISSGGLDYGDLRVEFIIDEDMKNYINVWKWLQKNNLAENYSEDDPEYSDGRILILNSNLRTNITVNFENLFATGLSDLSFDVTDEDVDYFTASVDFKYVRYYFLDKDNQRI